MQIIQIYKKIQKFVCFVGLSMSICLVTGCSKEQAPEEIAQELWMRQTDEVADSLSKEDETKDVLEKEAAKNETIYVQICGAVQRPGVYEMKPKERVFQLIELAGGLTPDAYVQSVNQAREVCDGEVIVIYTLSEWQDFSEQNGELVGEAVWGNGPNNLTDNHQRVEDDLININTADVTLLGTLPGIGEKLAGRIVEYRESHGDFQEIEQIKQVSGIGISVYDKIKDKIKI